MKGMRLVLALALVLAGLVLAVPTLALAASPDVVSISPTSGPPGTPVTIQGANFQAGAKAVLGPAVLGSCALPGHTMAVAVSGSYAYVAGSGLTVIDVSNPHNPLVVGSCATPDFGRGVAVNGSYAYVVGGDWTACNGFLQVINIGDPASPYVVGSLNWSYGVGCDIALLDNSAYVADGYYGLRVIGVGHPDSPAIEASLAVPGSAGGIALTGSYAYGGGYAYLSAGQSGLHVVDISIPGSPALVATCDTPGYTRNVALAGSLVYVTDDWAGLQAIDVSNPAAPHIVGACATSHPTYGIAIAGSYAYVTEDDYGLQVLDITNPAAPRIAVSIPTAGTGSEFNPAVWGGKTYVARELSGLDIASPFQPLQGVSYIDSGTLGATVAASQGPGAWDLHVVNPDGGEDMLPAAFSVPPVYTITDLGTLGGEYSDAWGMNNLGQVVGRSPLTQEGEEHAFLWTPEGGMQDLGTLGGYYSNACGIADNGPVVGNSSTASLDYHAFLWTAGGGMQDLGTLGGTMSAACGINQSGQVAGWSLTASGAFHAFLWTAGGGMQDLGTLGGTTSMAYGINQSGQVVGDSRASGAYHAFLWTAGGGMQDLGTLPGFTYSSADSINESGHAVGSCDVPPGDQYHAFFWTPEGGMQDLGTLVSEGASTAAAINDYDHVVGRCTNTPGSEGLGFLWRPGVGMVDLNYLIDAPGWVLWRATGINNSGQIVGYGLQNGARHAFLLTPINHPPAAPSNPTPANGATRVGKRPTLTWACSDPDPGDTLAYDVYLGENPGSLPQVATVTTPSWHTGFLDSEATYYWQVVARDSRGAQTPGPVWSFATNIFPTIESITPEPALTGQLTTIQGYNFAGTPRWIRVGTKYIYPGNARIISWAENQIVFRMFSFAAWPSGTIRVKPVQVKVNAKTSNIYSLSIKRP